MSYKKAIIGIIGGLGAGKSTVAQEFAKRQCAIIYADKINHEILAQPKIVAQLVDWWGDRILNAQEAIDRSALAEIVFNDQKELKKLTDLVHPMVLEKQNELIKAYNEDPTVKAIVLDVPLLAEMGWDKACDCLVFVDTDQSVRWQRLHENRKWSDKMIKNVEKLQIVLDKKEKLSEYRIKNNSDISDLPPQVDRILSLIAKK